MSSSSTSTKKGKGKGSERKKKKRRQQHHQEPRETETAPHIMAALEAQRARASQQSLPTPAQQQSAPATAPATTTPPPPPLPGYVFDPARNRFFRMVKDSLGTPGSTSTNSMRRGVNDSNHTTNMRRKLTIPIAGVRDEGSRMMIPQRKVGNSGWGVGARGSRSNKSNGSGGVGSAVSSDAARVGGPAAVTAGAGGVAPGARPSSRTAGGRGLHSFAMNSRRGLWGFGSRMPGSHSIGAVGGMPGGPERKQRAGVESIVSSSRFRLEALAPWAHRNPGAAYSAIDWDADRNLLAVGTVSGALGVMTTGLEWSASGGGDRPRQGFAPWRSGARREDELVCWATAASWASGKVSDIKFRTNGNEWACATASLGSAGEPGGVNARFWREGGQEGARDVEFFSSARVCENKLRRGSVWCTEWDPLTPSRLAVGPSSSSPVAFFDVETQQLTPVAKLSGDVFSMSFLPITAPGAGHAFVCGLRDGSVVLVDPRQPSRQTLTTTVARNPTCAGSGGGSGSVGGGSRSRSRGGSRQTTRFSGTRHSGGSGGCSADTELLVRLDCSSVDHTHILRDGTRCLVKDRSGGLQSVDLRFFSGGGRGNGSDPGRGQGRARPLKVLVPPGARAPAPGRFALDPTETVVVTPVPAAAAAAAAAAARGGNGGGAVVTGGAWDAFSSSGAASRSLPNAISDGNRAAVGNHGGDTIPPLAGRDRLRILNVSSGEELNDIQTPWTGVSLAPERGAAAAPIGPGRLCGVHGVRFWGTAWEPGQGATVFEARLRSEPSGGYGRL